MSYGTYTNLELLEHYGFILVVNPNEKAFIRLDIDSQKFSSWPKEFLYIHPDGSPSFALLCTLRLWATPANLRRSVGHRAYSGSLLSAENELFIMKWLANHCQNILGQLPTTLENDELLVVIIDKMLDYSSYQKCIDLLSSDGELNSFFQDNGLLKEGTADYSLSPKVKKSLERWRLAVQWRCNHKKILLNCVSYCNSLVDRVSSDRDFSKRMDYI